MQRRSNSTADRSFAIGVLAETMEAMGASCEPFGATLYDLCMHMTRDEDEEVRSNAIYAVGVLCSHTPRTSAPYPYARNAVCIFRSDLYEAQNLVLSYRLCYLNAVSLFFASTVVDPVAVSR